MPLKIVQDLSSPERTRQVVYVPDPYDIQRERSQARPRPLHGAHSTDAAGRLLRDHAAAAAPQRFVGLDLGQASDWTALCVVERTAAGLTVPFLSRTRGRPYTEVVSSLVAFMARPELVGARLVVDATGLGRPVIDLARASGLDPMAITITGGRKPAGTMRNARVPKRDIVTGLLVALESGALTVAAGLDLAPVLARELGEMRRKLTAAGNDTYGAWGDDAHDDLVLAVGLALWVAERTPAH
ncbi:MAG: hypothetical protein DI629_12405 [Mesorhizobium amorphae]|nr:MAG: hypothetical protein DI629_12405 [Mesorhizobium amorphae]